MNLLSHSSRGFLKWDRAYLFRKAGAAFYFGSRGGGPPQRVSSLAAKRLSDLLPQAGGQLLDVGPFNHRVVVAGRSLEVEPLWEEFRPALDRVLRAMQEALIRREE